MDGDGVHSDNDSVRADAGHRGRWHYAGLGLPRSLAELRFRDVAVIVIVGLTIWGYVDIGPRGRIAAGQLGRHRTDFTVFTEAAEALIDGRNPYNVTNPRGWHYLYPPLFALFVAPLTPFDAETQVCVWFFINGLLAFGCFAEARKLWHRMRAADTKLSGWVAVCAAMAMLLPTLDCMQAGQLGLAILYLLMVGFRLVHQGRSWPVWFFAGLILALPAAVKLVPALPVIFLVCQRWAPVRFATRAQRPVRQVMALTAGVLLGAYLFLFSIPGLFLGWPKNLECLRIWHERVVNNQQIGITQNFNVHSFRNQSLANGIYLLTRAIHDGQQPSDPGDSLTPPAVKVVLGGMLVLLALIGLAMGRRSHDIDQATAFGLACYATLVLSPLAWAHYFVVELPALVCVPFWLFRRGRSTLAWVVPAVPPLLSWCYYLTMKTTGPLGLLGLGTAAWFVLVCGLVLVLDAMPARRTTLYRPNIRTRLANRQPADCSVTSEGL